MEVGNYDLSRDAKHSTRRVSSETYCQTSTHRTQSSTPMACMLKKKLLWDYVSWHDARHDASPPPPLPFDFPALLTARTAPSRLAIPFLPFDLPALLSARTAPSRRTICRTPSLLGTTLPAQNTSPSQVRSTCRQPSNIVRDVQHSSARPAASASTYAVRALGEKNTSSGCAAATERVYARLTVVKERAASAPPKNNIPPQVGHIICRSSVSTVHDLDLSWQMICMICMLCMICMI